MFGGLVLAGWAELDVSNRELQSFGYSVAHDPRARLRHINAFSQLLVHFV